MPNDISRDILCFRESRRDARGPPMKWTGAATRSVTENRRPPRGYISLWKVSRDPDPIVFDADDSSI